MSKIISLFVAVFVLLGFSAPVAAQYYNNNYGYAPQPVIEEPQATKTCTNVLIFFSTCKPSKFIVAPNGALVYVDPKGGPPVVVTPAMPANPNTRVSTAAGEYRTGSGAAKPSYGGYGQQYDGYGGGNTNHLELANDPNAHCVRDAAGRATFCSPN